MAMRKDFRRAFSDPQAFSLAYTYVAMPMAVLAGGLMATLAWHAGLGHDHDLALGTSKLTAAFFAAFVPAWFIGMSMGGRILAYGASLQERLDTVARDKDSARRAERSKDEDDPAGYQVIPLELKTGDARPNADDDAEHAGHDDGPVHESLKPMQFQAPPPNGRELAWINALGKPVGGRHV